MIRAIIIDDEQHCINALEKDLEMFCPNVTIIAKCCTAKDGLLLINKLKPDLVFLDIEMPVINGLELLDMMSGQIDFKVIFTTAYEQFAARAFRVSAIDYLLKPIHGPDLIGAVLRVQLLIDNSNNQQVNSLLINNKLPPDEQVLPLPNRNGFDFVRPKDILYCGADGAYTNIFLKDNTKILISKSLKEFENLLPEMNFERIHHSYLINIKHIKQFKTSDGLFIVLTNGEQLPVSRAKKNKVMERIGL